MRKDVSLRLLPASMLGSVACMILYLEHIQPLMDEGNHLAGLILVALSVTIAFGLIPGYVMRRAEYGADKLAVKLLGEAGTTRAGLVEVSRADWPGSELQLGYPSILQQTDSRYTQSGSANRRTLAASSFLRRATGWDVHFQRFRTLGRAHVA